MILDYLSVFPHLYTAEVVDELPTDTTPEFFPPGVEQRGGETLFVRIRPESRKAWFGAFAFGFGGGAVTVVSSTPATNTLCIVSRGVGYFVCVDEPKVWSEVSLVPVTDFRPIPEHNLIVMASYTHLAAFSTEGLLWRTGQISWDGITITNVGRDHIEGEAWDPTTSVPPKFRVDLRTGRHEGGSSPLKYGLTKPGQ
jgi:hypothetical protein